MGGADAQYREESHKEHNYSHAAEPLGKRAPQEDALVLNFDRSEHGGPGGGEAGHGLKVGIQVVGQGSR